MKPLNKYIDHTLLKADATLEQIAKLCKEAIDNDFFSVCVNSYRIPEAYDIIRDTNVFLACVVGFPLGAMSTECKVYEVNYACDHGADEIDMVINIGAIKDGNWKIVEKDISEVAKAAYEYDATLKVILETCLLTSEEIVKACKVAVSSGADYVKTSTGFSTCGATVENVKLMKDTVADKALVKASGGIRTREQALKMIEAGADRLGVSASIAIVKGK